MDESEVPNFGGVVGCGSAMAPAADPLAEEAMAHSIGTPPSSCFNSSPLAAFVPVPSLSFSTASAAAICCCCCLLASSPAQNMFSSVAQNRDANNCCCCGLAPAGDGWHCRCSLLLLLLFPSPLASSFSLFPFDDGTSRAAMKAAGLANTPLLSAFGISDCSCCCCCCF